MSPLYAAGLWRCSKWWHQVCGLPLCATGNASPSTMELRKLLKLHHMCSSLWWSVNIHGAHWEQTFRYLSFFRTIIRTVPNDMENLSASERRLRRWSSLIAASFWRSPFLSQQHAPYLAAEDHPFTVILSEIFELTSVLSSTDISHRTLPVFFDKCWVFVSLQL